MRLESSKSTGSTSPSPTVTLVRNGPLNTACRTLIEESSGCEDDQAALQGAENRSCLAQVMRSGTVGLGIRWIRTTPDGGYHPFSSSQTRSLREVARASRLGPLAAPKAADRQSSSAPRPGRS